MKHSKIQPDQQGQHGHQQQQQKQQQKTKHEQGSKKPVQDSATYQEHEHPESRMTD
jgi:hypothetical protein